MRRFSRWLSCFLFITRPWLRAGWCPTVLISLNSHNRPVPIQIHPLLQVGCRCPRPYFEASGQSLAADEARMSAYRLQHRFVPVDPERDPVGVVVPCLLPGPLHPIHYLAARPSCRSVSSNRGSSAATNAPLLCTSQSLATSRSTATSSGR